MSGDHARDFVVYNYNSDLARDCLGIMSGILLSNIIILILMIVSGIVWIITMDFVVYKYYSGYARVFVVHVRDLLGYISNSSHPKDLLDSI